MAESAPKRPKLEKVYLDYNATTPLAPEVQEAVTKAMKEAWGNPSSSSEPGVKARKLIDDARNNVAFMVGSTSAEVVFTSGGTESNNWIFQMALKYFYEYKCPRKTNMIKGEPCTKTIPHFITSNIEHDSVRCALEQLEREGLAEVTFVKVSHESGQVSVEDVVASLQPNTVMITVMLANNETGVLQPVAEISRAVQKMSGQDQRSKRVLLHTDAAQALGKIPVDVTDLGVDFLTIVGHKFYAPRIGAVYIRSPNKDTPVYPMLFGGGQERGFRPGTENTPMIAGLGKGAELVFKDVSKYESHFKEVRDYLEEQLEVQFGDKIKFNGKYSHGQRLPNTCNVSFVEDGLEGHLVLAEAEFLQASVGAACHSQNKPSHILIAMGVPLNFARNALRLSVGRETTKEDIDIIVKDLKETVASILS